MTTATQPTFEINGVIDTTKTVLQNLEIMCSAAGSWLSYDIAQGKWAVVINQSGSSEVSFNDSNIIGSINLSSTGIKELYNSVEIEYPDADLKDRKDYINLSIDPGDRYPNEPDNQLQIQTDLVNNSVQAAYLAARELKQSRVDKVIEFRTDYSYMGLKAGILIDVTNEAYGFTNKVFRVIRVTEDDADDGIFTLSITALEYDADVYNTDGLAREDKSIDTGIVSKEVNTATTSKDNEAGLPLDLSDIAKALGLVLIFNKITGKWQLSQGGGQVAINASNAVIEWTFSDGSDLDIRCRMYYPDMGQSTVQDCLGWTGGSGQFPAQSTLRWPASGTAVLIWGGDNTGTGKEAVAVNVAQLKVLYPSQQYFVIECRGNWYGTPGIQPVNLNATVYTGGSLSASGYTFTNSGYTKARAAQGVTVFIDANSTSESEAGTLMGYLVIDVTNNVAQFINTPSDIGL